MTPPEIPGRADHDCRKIVAQQGGATSSTRHSLQRRRPTEIDRAMLVDEDRPIAREGKCLRAVPCRPKTKRGDTMKPTRNVALDCAMVCLVLGVVSMIAIPPASAERASDSTPKIAPAL